MAAKFNQETISDSITHNLLERNCDNVWISDSHRADVTYSICISMCPKVPRVTVVFQGIVNLDNWLANIQSTPKACPNPSYINEHDKQQLSSSIKLRTGFCEYLWRKRWDNIKTKLDAILRKAHQVGQMLLQCDKCKGATHYQLNVMGHSLGGALSMIFGFYVAARARSTSSLPLEITGLIRVYTFESPMSVDETFGRAFMYLKESPTILLACFRNSGDMIPMVVPVPGQCFGLPIIDFGSIYKHAGTEIRSHSTRNLFRRFFTGIDVSYQTNPHSYWSEVRRNWKIFPLFYVLAVLYTLCFVPLTLARLHGLMESIRFLRQIRLGLAKTKTETRDATISRRLKTIVPCVQILSTTTPTPFGGPRKRTIYPQSCSATNAMTSTCYPYQL